MRGVRLDVGLDEVHPALDPRAADDPLGAVGEADERLALAVVVRRPDDERRVVTCDPDGLVDRGRGAEPVAQERVLLALAPDRRLLGVAGEHARLVGSSSSLSTDSCTCAASPPPTASLKSRSPEKQRPSTTNVTWSSAWPGVGIDCAQSTSCVPLDAEAPLELRVAGDVVVVRVGRQQRLHLETLSLDDLEQRLERRAAVDEEGLPGCSSQTR